MPTDRPAPDSVSADPLRRRAEEWIVKHSYLDADADDEMDLARLLERVVRECAEEACNGGHPKSEVLFHWDLSESEESRGRP